MASAKELSGLLHTLYSAPTRPELWPIFLRKFTDLLELSGAAILSQDFKKAHYRFRAAVGVDPDGLAQYENYYGAMDAWRPRFLTKTEGELVFGEELCPLHELYRTEYYNDYLLKFDIELCCAIATVKRPTRIELVSLYKGWKDQPPSRESLELIRLVLPHLHIALRTRSRLSELETKSSEFINALDVLDFGVALFDEAASCVFINRTAEKILSEKDGLYIKDSRLSARMPVESATLHSLIDRAARARPGRVENCGGAMLITRDSKAPMQVVVSSFGSEHLSGTGNATAIAFISVLGCASNSFAGMLRSLYEFTPAECRLAELLANGQSLIESATVNHVTYETVRSQLKSMFNKTGVRRQSELMRILSALPRVTGRKLDSGHNSQG